MFRLNAFEKRVSESKTWTLIIKKKRFYKDSSDLPTYGRTNGVIWGDASDLTFPHIIHKSLERIKYSLVNVYYPNHYPAWPFSENNDKLNIKSKAI